MNLLASAALAAALASSAAGASPAPEPALAFTAFEASGRFAAGIVLTSVDGTPVGNLGLSPDPDVPYGTPGEPASTRWTLTGPRCGG